ncbi:chaperone DNAJ protein [Trypanosoma grayi]|uniref:chaperone DNAJ protein n=1 Tax=Trypanosoma grayi TaxID=71804 RepID=UPI0004F4A7B8|nr:chaperone DNAJ protein [Trypanosoma grayi]KEG07677.1 chaperone DNAJ protein [Trypanosoma grayi]
MATSDAEDEREYILLRDFGGHDAKKDPDPSGYYAALGVSQNASQTQIRRAFLHLSQSYHTDKHSGDTEDVQQLMNERFQKLQEAYTVLSDEKQRVAYDISGEQGVNRLALIPQNVNRREDIAHYLSTLEREAELRGLAKMLSATSSMTVTYSIAHFFLPRVVSSVPALPHSEEKADDTGMGPPNEASNEETQAAASNAVSEASERESTGADVATPQLKSEVMVAKEVEIDGRHQIVLVPNEGMQAKLREQIVRASGGNNNVNDAAAPSSPSAVATSVGRHLRKTPAGRAQLSLMEKAMLAAVPRRINFRHSFQHVVTPTLGVWIQTTASQEGNRARVGCKTIMEYQPDDINMYACACNVSVKWLKISFIRKRVLNVMWTLKTKLVALDGVNLLRKFELSLDRRLSSMYTLQNSWVMSLRDHGLFKTGIFGGSVDGVKRGIYTFIGYNNLGVHMYDERPIVYGDSDAEKEDAAQGRVLTTFGLMGATLNLRYGIEAWYFFSKWQHFGIGFSTLAPMSSYFSTYNARHPGFMTIQEISLLYARGERRISIPIVVFASQRLQMALMWAAAPYVLYRVARIVWRPFQRGRIVARYRQERLRHQPEMDVARMRTAHEQRALEHSVMRNRLREESIAGLVIINAKYGVLNPRYPEALQLQPRSAAVKAPWWRRWWAKKSEPTTAPSAQAEGAAAEGAGDVSSIVVLDVTAALQNFVQDSKLVLPRGSKSKLVGFTDPDPFTAERKELVIVYWFQRKRHTVTVSDEDEVELPRREHLID